jgi:hypothetical protein
VGDVKRLSVGAINRIPRPQHAAIQLFNGPSHDPIVTQPSASPVRAARQRLQLRA